MIIREQGVRTAGFSTSQIELELADGPGDLSITYLGPKERSHRLLRVRILESLESEDD